MERTMDEITREDLNEMIRAYGRQKKFATDVKVSVQFINMIVHGKKEPSQKVLDALGLERIVRTTYRPRTATPRAGEGTT